METELWHGQMRISYIRPNIPFPLSWPYLFSSPSVLASLDRDCAKGFCLPEKRREQHRAVLVQRKHPQIPGMEKTCRTTSPRLPPSPSVGRGMWLETHKCWQGAVEGNGVTAAAD